MHSYDTLLIEQTLTVQRALPPGFISSFVSGDFLERIYRYQIHPYRQAVD